MEEIATSKVHVPSDRVIDLIGVIRFNLFQRESKIYSMKRRTQNDEYEEKRREKDWQFLKWITCFRTMKN